ncbi:phosphotransferase [Kosakonia sp. MUSA4]|uniref:phosphotransferase n=1 Tax=Kosakonia sp. MUSA4 TaxID=2067958 RepID=UPI0015981546|nr:phosphotransferase [Kosakonia sp. MUSA4]QJT83052.1 3-hydroxyacyl-ACP dehydratase [Kosakonia sp. MUSA4]
MNNNITARLVSLRPAEFSFQFATEQQCHACHSPEGVSLSLNGQIIHLPALTLLHKEPLPNGHWQATFTCFSAQENKRCYWQLKLCQPAEEMRTPQPALPKRHLYAWSEKERQKRLCWLRQHTGHALERVSTTGLQAGQLKKNLEGFIGSVEVPVGIAGPLNINGQYASGLFYAPMATTEGALVASVSRGASAITQSGGVATYVLGQRMMRVPRFAFDTVRDCLAFCAWIEDHSREIGEVISRHSRYARLIEMTPKIIGNAVHLAFIYQTADAAGQNMTTTCTWQACQWIQRHVPSLLAIRHFIIDGNLSSDKKASWATFAQGRGTQVIAEARLTETACRTLLRIAPAQLVDAFHIVSEGAVAAGMTGLNINAANVIAAMFTALGQDIACSHESSLAQLQMRLMPDNSVYCSITLPALVIGTVGGGTGLPDQAECLEMLGCRGEQGRARLAEIIAGFCLALDISTLSALASDEFARSHETLGRQRGKRATGGSHRDPLQRCFQQARYTPAWGFRPPVEIRAVPWQGNQDSILTANCSDEDVLPMGIFAYQLQRDDGAKIDVVLKNKPQNEAISRLLRAVAAGCNPRIEQHLQRLLPLLEFSQARERETQIIQQTVPAFTRHSPQLYGLYLDATHSIIIEERLQNALLLNSLSQGIRWQAEHINAALAGIAQLHAHWYRQQTALTRAFHHLVIPDAQAISSMIPLWQETAEFIHREHGALFSAELLHEWLAFLDTSAESWREMESMPRTLVHNDFNPRNIALREDDLRLCCWDWELATLHIPQRDLAELLTCTLPATVSKQEMLSHVEFHRQQLETLTGEPVDAAQWYRGYCLALRDYGVRRLSFYLMLHHVSPQPWFLPLWECWGHLVRLTRHDA